MFGQVVIGPPGAGKTTYCRAMQEFLKGMGRKLAVVNLDPANDSLPYDCSLDVSELITLSDVMDNLKLGPNGGLIYCMEYLEKNLDWLHQRLGKLEVNYVLFDCPGQVELYTHNNAVKHIFAQLTKWDYRVAAVHLVDSHYCSDPAKFISVLMTSLSTMLQVELPHVNVLSKADLIEQYGKLPFNLDFFTDVLDMTYLLDQMRDDPFFQKYKKLNEAMVGVVQDYSLVAFSVLDIQDKESMLRVTQTVDKANGYVFGDLEERNLQNLMSCAVGAEFEYEKIASIREKYMSGDGLEKNHDDTDDMET